MAHASGKYAKAISDRSGMEFPYKEMVKEWNGSLVHKSEFEAKHPQQERQRHAADAQSLQDARPARSEPLTVFVGGVGFLIIMILCKQQIKTTYSCIIYWYSISEYIIMAVTYAELTTQILDYRS